MYVAFASELRVAEVWCVQGDNRAAVVQTAVAEERGSAAGDDTLFVPTGKPDTQLDVFQWRQRRAAEFRGVCEKTYEALTGNPAAGPTASGVTGESDDSSVGEEFLIGTASGAVLGVAGGLGGYQLTRLARRNERKFSRASGLGEGLGALGAELEALLPAYESGNDKDKDRAGARRAAEGLQAKIPSSATAKTVAARNSLSALLGLLVPAKDGQEREARANELKSARAEMSRAVGELIGEVDATAKVGWKQPG